MNNLGRNSDIIWLNISVGHDTLFSPVQGVYLQLYILCTSFRFYCQSAYFAELYCFLQHLAAAKGYEEIVRFLIQHGANTNCIGDQLDNPYRVTVLVACCSFVQFPCFADNFGNSPLFEAVKAGHDRTALLLIEDGATLNLEDAGWYLCKAVMGSNIDLLKRLLENGVDPNSRNYDLRTPLHFAAAEGLHLVANILIKFGADVLSKDRYYCSLLL